MTKRNVFPTRLISTANLQIPVLGFGGAPLGGMMQANNNADAARMLSSTHDAGFRYFDTAPFYGFGRSERMVGDHLRERNFVISTKVGRLLEPGAMDDPAALGWPDALPFHPVFDYSYDGVMRSYEHSLQRLGLDRIDILFVHDIGEMTHGADNRRHFENLEEGGYRALDELRSSGDVKAIGMGVNEVQVCRDALKIGDWDVFLLAGRYTLLEQNALSDLLPECVATDTSIIIGGPYNSGILAGGDTWNYSAAPPDVIAKVAALKDCAAKHKIAMPAAALQFPLAHPSVVSVVLGLRNIDELNQTIEWVSTDIPAAFWQDLRDQGLLDPLAPTPDTNPFRG